MQLASVLFAASFHDCSFHSHVEYRNVFISKHLSDYNLSSEVNLVGSLPKKLNKVSTECGGLLEKKLHWLMLHDLIISHSNDAAAAAI